MKVCLPIVCALSAGFGLALLTGQTQAQCPGDVDGNGYVNFDDFNIIIDNYSPLQGGDCKSCDINGDGFVNGEDLSIAVYELSGPCPTETRPCPTDFNIDDDIDFLDYFILVGWYGQDCEDGKGNDNACSRYDVDGGGVVDFADLVLHFFRILGPGC